MKHLALTLFALSSVGCNCGGTNSSDDDDGGAVHVTQDGGAGESSDSCRWERTLGPGGAVNITDSIALDDNSIVVVGAVSGAFADGSTGAFAARVSANGTILWQTAYGRSAYFRRVIRANDGELLLGGYATSTRGCANHHGGRDALLAKVRVSDGARVLQTCIGGDDDDEAYDLREYTDEALGAAIHLTGSTDSHLSFDVGPKHGGGGLESSDLMNAVVSSAPDGGLQATVACIGSVGPEVGVGFLDDGSILGSTFGDNTGDLKGNPPPQFIDLLHVRTSSGLVCRELTCSVIAARIGGNANDEVTRVLSGNWLLGHTRSNDAGVNPAGFGCAGASQTSKRPFLARWAGGLTQLRCLASETSGQIEAVDFDNDGPHIWLTVINPPSDGDFSRVDAAIDAGAKATTAMLRFDSTLQNITRSIRLSGATAATVAFRPDGCAVVAAEASDFVRLVAIRP